LIQINVVFIFFIQARAFVENLARTQLSLQRPGLNHVTSPTTSSVMSSEKQCFEKKLETRNKSFETLPITE